MYAFAYEVSLYFPFHIFFLYILFFFLISHFDVSASAKLFTSFMFHGAYARVGFHLYPYPDTWVVDGIFSFCVSNYHLRIFNYFIKIHVFIIGLSSPGNTSTIIRIK